MRGDGASRSRTWPAPLHSTGRFSFARQPHAHPVVTKTREMAGQPLKPMSIVLDGMGGSSTVRAFRSTKLPHAVGRIDRAELCRRVASAMARNLPTSLHAINTAREWAVIGGGPSINQCVGEIRKLQRRGVAIVSVNKSHDWLLSHGIVPWGHVLLDPKEWVADYVSSPRKDVRHFVASQCHESVFEKLKDYPVFLWHAGQDFPEDGATEPDSYLKSNHKPGWNWHITPGPTTVGLRAPLLGHALIDGPDKFHMFGMDSSRTHGKLHAYAKDEAKDAQSGVKTIQHNAQPYRFDTNSHMARQFDDFDKFMGDLEANFRSGKLRPGFSMKFYGSGLLPFYAAKLGLHADPICNADPTLVGGYMSADEARIETKRILMRPNMRVVRELKPVTTAEVLALAELAQANMPGPITIPAHMLLD